MSDECLELKNIKYKTMLLNGNNKQFDISKSDKISIVDNFLETENKKNGEGEFNWPCGKRYIVLIYN